MLIKFINMFVCNLINITIYTSLLKLIINTQYISNI